MVKREGQDAGWLENATGFVPTLSQNLLIERIMVIWMPSLIRDCFESLGRVFCTEYRWVLLLEWQSEPSVEEVRKLGVVKKSAEWWISHYEVVACSANVW